MEAKNPMSLLRGMFRSPGGLEISLAFVFTLLDLILIRHAALDPLFLVFSALQVAIVAVAMYLPGVAIVVVPATFLCFALVSTEQAPLRVFCALLIVEVMRARDHKIPAIITAVALWLVSNFDPSDNSFASDGVAVIVATLLLLVAYFIGSMRSQSRKQREQAEHDAVEALQQQRLELATVLHDSTAKSFTRVTMLAQALAIGYEDREKELTEPLDDIAETAREGLLQLRQLLALLKSDGDESSLFNSIGPDERVPKVKEVLTQAKTELEQAGFTVSLATQIDQEPSLTRSSEVIGPAISEICTNIEKYAEPHSAIRMLAVSNEEDGLSLIISNHIASTLPNLLPRAVLSSGIGLSSLRRRIRPFNGSVETKREGNTWSTILRLPPPTQTLGKGRKTTRE